MFSIIRGVNESKTLTKHVSCKCNCKFDGRKCNSDQWWNNNIFRCECNKRHACEKDYLWNPSTCNCVNRKYIASIIDHSAIMYDEVIESWDDETNFNEKKAT